MSLALPLDRPAGPRWARLSLATRFALAAGVVLTLATLAIGAVVTTRLEQAVVRNAANATARFVDAVIAPVGQQLGESGDLSPGARRALEEIFSNSELGERVLSFKFWDLDGRVIWAENKAVVGQTFPLTEELGRALAGEVVGSFDSLGDEEDVEEASTGLPLLEIYSPVREAWSGRVIAVAEFYEVATDLDRDLRTARASAWTAVAGTTLLLGSLLYVIVLGGSRTIEAQQGALDARLAELRELSGRNHELRLRVQAAAARAAAQADRAMRGIGADLHDGPAQHLAYAALRLDSLRDRLDGTPEAEEIARVAGAVQEALGEVRALSRGLQPPEMASRPVSAILEGVAQAHEARTGHAVSLRLDCDAEPALDPAAKLCLYRFAQEGLANASRHAGGAEIELALDCREHALSLAVRDRGPGLPDHPREGGMGLAGLRDRVESLGGTFQAGPRPGGGTEIRMILEPGGPAWT